MKAQAEISFKAGYREGVAHQYDCQKADAEFNEKTFGEPFKRAGRKEVMEWVETHNTIIFFDPFGSTPRRERWMDSVNHEDWQTKLKEWDEYYKKEKGNEIITL